MRWLVSIQGLTINLKRVYVSTYMLKHLGVRYEQGKNYKSKKKARAQRIKTKDEKRL